MANTNLLGKTALISALVGSGLLSLPYSAMAADSLDAALKESKTTLSFRPRYENVTQEGIASGVTTHSDAATLKTRLTFSTGRFFDTAMVLEFDDVTSLKDVDYNDGSNGEANPVIADPEGTEVNQAYLSFTGLDKTDMRWGRQRILLDNQRFVGGVGWRQNEQTYDGFSVTNTSVPNLTLFLAQINNVNRIFGEESRPANKALWGDHSQDTQLFNGKYSIAGIGDASVYYYRIDNQYVAALSTKTTGARFAGAHALDAVNLGYELEYAQQSEAADNPKSFDADYTLLSLSATYSGFTFGLAQETLGADKDAGVAFSTPLATLHKFEGWADVFLNTPATGIVDQYATFKYGFPMGFALMAVYHDFSSDEKPANGDDDFGSEVDVQLTKTFANGATVQLKYADYSGNENGVATPASVTSDVSKFWLTATYAI